MKDTILYQALDCFNLFHKNKGSGNIRSIDDTTIIMIHYTVAYWSSCLIDHNIRFVSKMLRENPSMQPLMHIPYGFSLSYESMCHTKFGPWAKDCLLLRRLVWRTWEPMGSSREEDPDVFFSDRNTVLFTLRIHPPVTVILSRALQLVNNKIYPGVQVVLSPVKQPGSQYPVYGGKHRLVIAYTATYWSGTESIIHLGASHGNGKGVPTQEGLNDKRCVWLIRPNQFDKYSVSSRVSDIQGYWKK